MSVTERRPICPSCNQPLCGELVASACNHVFHRGCLSAAIDFKKGCAQCGEDLRPKLEAGLRVRIVGLTESPETNGQNGTLETFDPERGRWTVRLQGDQTLAIIKAFKPQNLDPIDKSQAALNLYGVNFGEGLEGGIAAFIAKMSEEDSGAAVARIERLRKVAALLGKKHQVKKMREQLSECREQIAAARDELDRQVSKHAGLSKVLSKKKDEVAKEEAAVKRDRDLCISLQSKIDYSRQRDTAYEYWEKIKSGQQEQALRYVQTMAGIAAVPARITCEVLRLKCHVGETLERDRKEAAASASKLGRARRQLEDLQLKERKLAQKSRARAPGDLPAKRPRI